MPRPPRLQFDNGIFHVGTGGNRRQPLFTNAADATRFMNLFADVAKPLGWRSLAYCLMTNHYHFVIRTPGETLSKGLHRLNSVYAHYFNWRHGYTGHLFERRFHSKVVEGEAHLLDVCRYVLLNPVRAGLCASPAGWRWSSYRATVGLAPRPAHLAADELLELFSPDPARARQLFAEFLDPSFAAAA